jgi:hypothetical protein
VGSSDIEHGRVVALDEGFERGPVAVLGGRFRIAGVR